MSGDMYAHGSSFEREIDFYKFVDKAELYTNGIELVPVFRVLEAWEFHNGNLVYSIDRGTVCVDLDRQRDENSNEFTCSVCGCNIDDLHTLNKDINFCPHCGRKVIVGM